MKKYLIAFLLGAVVAGFLTFRYQKEFQKEVKEQTKSSTIEKYDSKTGKIVYRSVNSEAKKESEEKFKQLSPNKNHFYVGLGLDDQANQIRSVGYMRNIGFLNIGVNVQSDMQGRDKTILGTLGISF